MADGNHIRCEKYGREVGRGRRTHTLPGRTSGVVVFSRRIRATAVGGSVAVWRACGSLPLRLPLLLRIGHLALERPKDHGLSPRGARRQHTVVADERIPRRRNERREAREELERRQDEHLRAPTARLLDSVADASAGERSELLERKRRARAVATESLATEIVVRLDVHARVKIEPFMIHCVVRRFSRSREDLLSKEAAPWKVASSSPLSRTAVVVPRRIARSAQASSASALVKTSPPRALQAARDSGSDAARATRIPSETALSQHARKDGIDLVLRRRRRRMEGGASAFVANEHAVEDDDVQMH